MVPPRGTTSATPRTPAPAPPPPVIETRVPAGERHWHERRTVGIGYAAHGLTIVPGAAPRGYESRPGDDGATVQTSVTVGGGNRGRQLGIRAVVAADDRAPRLVRAAGLEWAYRIAREPARLWRRYAEVVPRFLWLVAREEIKARVPGARAAIGRAQRPEGRRD